MCGRLNHNRCGTINALRFPSMGSIEAFQFINASSSSSREHNMSHFWRSADQKLYIYSSEPFLKNAIPTVHPYCSATVSGYMQ